MRLRVTKKAPGYILSPKLILNFCPVFQLLEESFNLMFR